MRHDGLDDPERQPWRVRPEAIFPSWARPTPVMNRSAIPRPQRRLGPTLHAEGGSHPDSVEMGAKLRTILPCAWLGRRTGSSSTDEGPLGNLDHSSEAVVQGAQFL